jgi:hypothetical protein
MKLSWILFFYLFNKTIGIDTQSLKTNLLRTNINRFLQEDEVEIPNQEEDEIPIPEPTSDEIPIQGEDDGSIPEPEPNPDEIPTQEEDEIPIPEPKTDEIQTCPPCVCEFTTNPIEVLVHEDGVDLSLIETKLNNVKGLTVANLVIHGLVTCSLLSYVLYKTCV